MAKLTSTVLMLLAGLLAVSGCDFLVDGQGGNPDAGPPVASKSKSKAKAPTILAQPEEDVEEYAYNPIGKRDPFRSFLSLGTRTDTDHPRTPLQRYEIDQYTLVGIVWGVERPRALVEDPDGVGHVMEIGTYIGKNWGKVTQISPTEVVVTEEFQTIDGELVVNSIPMVLPVESLGEF